MERLTKKEKSTLSNGEEITICNHQGQDCNDSCMYGTCKWNKKALDKLKAYEDAEEQGLLLRLPCKVGDTVYLTEHHRVVMKDKPLICIIDEFTMSDNDCYAVLNANEPFYALHRFKAVNIKDFGKTVFLTKEEAEQKLAAEWGIA